MVFSLDNIEESPQRDQDLRGRFRQSEGDEMFGSSKIARVLVRFSPTTPPISSRMSCRTTSRPGARSVSTPMRPDLRKERLFDEVRGHGQSGGGRSADSPRNIPKLPLSTTYVTFMVAMGSSLADRAWGRESAVYRVTGVVSVIGGWFITVGAGHSLFVAMLMHVGGFVAACVIMLAIFLLVRSNIRYK